MTKHSYLAAAWWGLWNHPDRARIRILMRAPFKIRFEREPWDQGIRFSQVIRSPFLIWLPETIIEAYGEAVLGDRYWDIPF